MLRTNALPQVISVISSSLANVLASSCWMRIELLKNTFFNPTSPFLGCLGRSSKYGSSFAPLTWQVTAFLVAIAVCRGAIGSITLLFIVHSIVQSMSVIFLLGPWDIMNSCRAGTVKPRLRMPLTVGKRGSSQPDTAPFSTRYLSFRFDRRVLMKFSREKSQICTLRSFSVFNVHSYIAFQSRYSIVRRACVTPSIESTTGTAKW